MSMLASLAQQYFGMGSAGSMQLGQLNSIGAQFDSQIQQLTGEMGQWNPSAEGAIELSNKASAQEAGNVAAQEWTRQMQRYTRARLRAASIAGNHQKAMAQISLQTAKLQDQQIKGMIPLALQMGTTVASHQGYISGVQAGRSRLFNR